MTDDDLRYAGLKLQLNSLQELVHTLADKYQELDGKVHALQASTPRSLAGCKNFSARDGLGFCRNCGFHSSEHEGLEHTGPTPEPIAAPADPWSATGAIAKLAEHLEGRKGDDGLDMLTMRLGDARRIVNDHQALKRQLEEAQRNLEAVHRARLAEREAKELLTSRQHELLAQREALLREVVAEAGKHGLMFRGELEKRVREELEQKP